MINPTKPAKQTTTHYHHGHLVRITSLTTIVLPLVTLISCTETQKETAMTKPHNTHKTLPVTEDLMREHGVLSRALLIYEEIIRRINTNQTFAPSTVTETATIIRQFIEEYHEAVEEKYIFPLLEQKKLLVPLLKTLRDQHTKGRAVTAMIKELASSTPLNTVALKKELKKFIRMYRPHEAREDTEVFPLFRSLVSHEEIEKLGDMVEEMEEKTLGKHGFSTIVTRIEHIEKDLGIYQIEQFTAKNEPLKP